MRHHDSSIGIGIAYSNNIGEREKEKRFDLLSRFFLVSLCCASAGCRRPRIALQYNISEHKCQEKSQIYNNDEYPNVNLFNDW